MKTITDTNNNNNNHLTYTVYKKKCPTQSLNVDIDFYVKQISYLMAIILKYCFFSFELRILTPMMAFNSGIVTCLALSTACNTDC